MTVLECNPYGRRYIFPRIARYEVHLVEMKRAAILLFGGIALRHIHYIVVHILLYHIPWASAQAEPFALADCVKPESVVLAQFAACLQLDDSSFPDAEMALDKIVVIDFAKEAYPLAVFSESIGKACLDGCLAHLGLGHSAERKHQVRQLAVGYAGEKVGLVFYRVDCRCKIFGASDYFGRGLVACGGLVEFMAPALFEESELNHLVAHDIGIRSKPFAHCAERIFHNIVPILLM